MVLLILQKGHYAFGLQKVSKVLHLIFRSEKVIPAITYIVVGLVCLGIAAWSIQQVNLFRHEAIAYSCSIAEFSDLINFGDDVKGWVGAQNLTN
jgi:hypothetical protein